MAQGFIRIPSSVRSEKRLRLMFYFGCEARWQCALLGEFACHYKVKLIGNAANDAFLLNLFQQHWKPGINERIALFRRPVQLYFIAVRVLSMLMEGKLSLMSLCLPFDKLRWVIHLAAACSNLSTNQNAISRARATAGVKRRDALWTPTCEVKNMNCIECSLQYMSRL